jgi:hypothetical protein
MPFGITLRIEDGKKMGPVLDIATRERRAWRHGDECALELRDVAGVKWLVVAGANVGRPIAGWRHAWDNLEVELTKRTVDGGRAPFEDEDWEALEGRR